MTTVEVIRRAPRAPFTVLEFDEPVSLPDPPTTPEPSAQNAIVAFVLPIVGSLGGLIFVFVHPTKMFIIAGVAMATLSITVGLINGITNRRAPHRRLKMARSRHREQLHAIGVQRAESYEKHIAAARAQLCSPDRLLQRAFDDATRWDRRPEDADFGLVRVGDHAPAALFGTASQASGHGMHSNRNSDPESQRANDQLLATVSLAGFPACIDLSTTSTIVVAGPNAVARAASLMLLAAVTHGPGDLSIAIDASARSAFPWAKWLPHLAANALDAQSDTTALTLDVVVADQVPNRASPRTGRVTVVVCPRLPATASSEPFISAASLFAVSPRHAESVARALAPFRIAEPKSSADIDAAFEQLVASPPGAGSLAFGRLQALLGASPSGEPVVLNINEAALGGIGPHGLCIGATGSGKSELLRTMVTSLALTHDPTQLNFVLVDFKGGAAFADLARLDHVAGVITNLANDAPLIERVRLSIMGELDRRQEVLANAGHMANITAYNEAVSDGRAGDCPPLPTLLILIDEFGELLVAQPDFVDVFTTIGRIGRSLGVHLLLASQRLEEGRLRGLESHLSYRICLRTFSAGESRAVIGSAIAADLPNSPGHAYLAAAGEAPQRLLAAYVSGPSTTANSSPPTVSSGSLTGRIVTVFDPWAAATAVANDLQGTEPGPSIVDRALRRQSPGGQRARQIWAPVLPTDLAFVVGVDRPDDNGPRPLIAPIGVGDLPAQQRQIAVAIDINHSNAVVVGGPRRGVSNTLITSVLALASTRSADEVSFHAIDMAGSLSPLASLHHMGTVASRRDPELVGRLLTWFGALVERREAQFAVDGIASIEQWRATCMASNLAERSADVVLVLDGWAQFRAEWPDAEPVVTAIGQRGPAVGVHVIVGATRWIDVKAPLRDTCVTKIELGLADVTESIHPRRTAAAVGPGAGRGLWHDGTLVQIAHANTPDGSIAAINAQHRDRPAVPSVPVLPRQLSTQTVPIAPPSQTPGIYETFIGMRERDLQPTGMTFDRPNPHLVVLGDAGCGLTNTLRMLCAQLAGPNPAAMFALVDYRRGLLDCVPANQVAMIATNENAAVTLVNDICAEVDRRLPPATVTPQQLAQRNWWQGPELFVVIDDEDLVSGGMSSPLARLAEVAVHGGDVGLHLIIGRRVAGMSRAAFAPLMSRMAALGTQTFVMSGEPQEGVVAHGERATTLPIGRGRLLRRRQLAEVIQVAYDER